VFHSLIFYVILLAATTWSQTSAPSSATEVAHYPQLIHADLPLYPPLARTLHVTGTVEIQVVIEKGAVVNAQVNSVVLTAWNGPALTDEDKKKVGNYLSDPSITNIKTWRFNLEDRVTFPVKYVYSIEGDPTTVSENPRVELDLPLLVKVTARPFKPICHDCSSSPD
jgi:hypothetical protein